LLSGLKTQPSPANRASDDASPDPSAEKAYEDFYEDAYKKRAFRVSGGAAGVVKISAPDAEEPAAA